MKPDERKPKVKPAPWLPELEYQGFGWWWTHPFYRSQWEDWRERWRKIVPRSEVQKLLKKFRRIGCDGDILVRLAFLEACRRQPDEPTVTPRNRQRVRKFMQQAEKHFVLGERLFENVARLLPFPETEFTEARQLIPQLIWWCRQVPRTAYEISERPPGGYELFTLVAYVRSFGKGPQYELVTNLLQAAYEGFDEDSQDAPTQEAVAKHVERFGKLRATSLKRFNSFMQDPKSVPPPLSGRYHSDGYYLYPETIEQVIVGKENHRLLDFLLRSQFPV